MEPGERQPLATMPLHTITASHGEAGLRERFALEIASFPDADQPRIGRALELAARLHAGDRRQREPYINHLLRVATRIISHYHVRDPDVICAALLHDAVEDHAAGLAAAVTNPDYGPSHDSHQRYRKHVAASLKASPWARVIKMSDFTDNGVGLIYTTGPRTRTLARKYAPLVPVLRDLITRSDTPLSHDVKARILGQLDRAQERFAAIAAAPRG